MERHSRRMSTSRDGHDSRCRYCSSSRERDRHRRSERRGSKFENYSDKERVNRERRSDKRRRRSRSWGYSDEERRRSRGSRRRKRERKEKQELILSGTKIRESRHDGSKDKGESENVNEKNCGIDYS